MIHVEQHGPVLCIRLARGVMGRPLYWTAAYWVEGLLIDTGPSCTAPQLLRMLEHVFVDRIVLTHRHEDHIGGLALLHERFPDAPIYAPRGALSTLRDPSRLHVPAYRRAFWGTPQGVDRARSYDEISDVVRTSSYSFRVVETPGHTPDHVSLFEPEQRWLFSGDAFISGEERAWSRETDLFGVLSSLRTLESLRPERLFPGSGHVRGGSAGAPLLAIHAKIKWLTKLAKDVATLEAKGATVPEMAAVLLDNAPMDVVFRWWTGGHFAPVHLIEACRSYNALLAPEPPSSGTVVFHTLQDEDEEDWADPPAPQSTDRDDVLR